MSSPRGPRLTGVGSELQGWEFGGRAQDHCTWGPRWAGAGPEPGAAPPPGTCPSERGGPPARSPRANDTSLPREAGSPPGPRRPPPWSRGPLTRRSPNRSRRRPWGWTLKAAPTGDQLVLTHRPRSPAPRPPSRRAHSIALRQPLRAARAHETGLHYPARSSAGEHAASPRQRPPPT